MALTLIPLSLFAGPPAAEGTDGYFVLEASSGGMAEVMLGQLAESNGASDAVKAFGKHMITDHSNAGDTLESLATELGITVPDEPMNKHMDVIKTLKELRDDKFDRSYAAQMVKDHEATIALYEKEAANGKSQELRSFASETLPVLRAHLAMAKALPR